MSPKVKRQTAARGARFSPTSTPTRRLLAQTLAFLLFAQASAPPALAAPARELPLASFGAAVTAKFGALVGAVAARVAPARPAAQVVPGAEFGLVLTPLGTAFNGHVGVEHHQPLRSVVVSSNSPAGSPLNFESLGEGGEHRPFSNVGGLTGELRLALARDDGQGLSLGGFQPGELLTGTGEPGRIARVSADGASVQNPWVTLPGEVGRLGEGLTIDRTGVFGGDLIAVTTAGGVWRVSSNGAATRVADLGTPLEGVATIPNSAAKYGPWAGKILAGAREQGAVYAIDAAGTSTAYQLGVTPGDIRVIPAHENFYGVDTGAQKIWGAPDDAFTSIIGDILIAQESPGVLAHVRWNGVAFEVGQVAQASRWGQIAFSPAGVAGVAGVKQVYDKIAVVRHAPVLDSGRVEGALWQLAGEDVVLDGTDTITSDLLVPGTPTVTLGTGRTTFGGVIEGVESRQPSGYAVTISNNASLRHVITRTDPFEPAPVAAPPAPAGARDLSLTRAGQPIGDPATLRHLSLSGQAGTVAVPPGTYGKFSTGGRTALVLGVPNSTQPAVYNLEELALSGGSELKLVGPVVLNVRGNVSLAGSSVGAADNPRLLLLSVAQGSVGVTGGGVLYGVVRIPGGSVSIGGNGRVRGTVTCDRLNVYGNGILQITESDVAPPPLNRPPAADAGPDQTITLPTDTVSLNGVVSDDGLPAGSTLTAAWTKVSGPGTVAFADPNSAVTSATFTEAGTYVLRLTASDSLLTTGDEMSVEVVPRNQPPVVNAGPDQSVELPGTATLSGTATDDALPRGAAVTTVWSVVSGPGSVTFADANALSTVATFGAPGTYTLRLTADDTEFAVSDELVITVHPENQPPAVGAGPDQSVRAGSPLALAGTATDDGLPTGSTLTSAWTKVSGPGPVTFGNTASPATTATFGVEGTYVLRLTADDSRFTVSDECVVTVLPRNAPPVVDAGADQEITFLESATLWGVATDDGLPVGSVLEVSWSVVSGPGAVVFANPTGTVTAATFAAPGTYVLRLTGDDTQFTASDETTVVVRPRPHASRVYTLNADFDQGSLINVTHATPDQIQLDSTTRSFNFIWVAVSTKGTVVKINTETGAIIGEYHTAPAGQPTDPSRTTVDQNGNVWATNRAGNSVVHIGLVENGQCVDRNGNGVINTSTGFNDIKQWPNTNGANTNGGVTLAQDECIIHYTKVNAFGTRHVSVNKDNDVWVSGTGGQKFDLIDGKTGVIKRSEPSVGYGGYGGLIDKNNVIWSANPMLRWDTSKPLTGSNNPLNGMAFTLYGGRATWDRAGVSSAQGQSERVWVEDSTPAGASLAGDSEGWNWTSANPTPFSGTLAHQSNIISGLHQHYFLGAANTLSVGTGEKLFSYVYLDPANPPREVMMQWNNGNWEHRAYWGENIIGWGTDGTESRRHMGPLPAAGQWVKLEVPASQVGLEGSGSNWRGYSHPSYGLCIDSGGNVYNTSYGNGTIRKFAPDGTMLASYNQGMPWAQGCVVDRNDHVWIAHSLSASSVGHMKSDGTYVGTITVGSGPTGVAVDGAGKVWATNYYSGTVSRINPAAGPLGPDGVTRVGAVDFTTPHLGGNPYNYSDMTGSTLTGAPQTGTWSTVFDSQLAGAEWGRVGWAAQVCGDGLLTVTVATSVDGTTYTQPVTVSNGDDPAVPNGRYIRIVARFERASSGESPVLYDLSVGTVGFPFNTPSNVAPGVSAGPDQTLGGVTQTELKASACDDALPSNRRLTMAWSQVSGPGTATFARHDSPVTGVTFSATGTYTLRLTASDSVHTSADTVIVTVVPGNQTPTVNAGPDQTVVLPASASLGGAVTDDGLPSGAALVPTWLKMSGPGLVTFGNVNQAATTASFSAAGTYVLRLEASDSQKAAFDDVTVTVQPSPNRTPEFVSQPQTDLVLRADSQPPAQATYAYDADASDADGDAITYSLTAAPQGMTVNQTTGLVSWPVTSANAGAHTVTLRAQDSKGAAATQTFTLRVYKPNQAPAVSAGDDRSISVSGTAALNGSVTDDGLPLGAAVVSAWGQVSGPGLVAFADRSSPATTATFSEAGTYVLRLTAADTELSAFDEVTVTVTPPNRAPSVYAGTDLGVTLPGAARLGGSALDDGLPLGAALTLSWGKVSGPGVAAFADAGSAATSATFSEPGVYVLRLTANDTELTGSDDVTVTVRAAAPNQGPSVNAGPDRTAVLNANLLLNAGNDEQLVGGEIRGWTEAAGSGWTRGLAGSGGAPESVNGDGFFYAGEAATAELRQDVDVSAFAATVAAGTQAFEWKAYVRSRAEALPDTARVILEYRNAANTAMIARLDSGDITSTGGWQSVDDTRAAPAGTGWIRIRLISTRRTGATNDAYFDALSLRPTTGAGVRLNGSVADDGLPAAGALGIGWTKVSGPGTVAFADAAAASTSATFSEAGVYVLRLSAGDSELSGSDEVSVTVEPRNLAPVVEAGADQTVTLPATAALSGVVTDDGRPAGAAVTSAWSKVSGPGAVTFSDPAGAVTTATFSAAGTYVLRLSASDSEYGGGDAVTITVRPVPPNQSPRVDAGADQLVNPPATNATLSGSATDDGQPTGSALSYLWTKVSGPGAVTFSNSAAASTSATFAEAGVYVLRLTASDSELTGSDDVRVTLNGTNKAPSVNAGADQTVAHPTTVTLGGSAADDGLPAGSALTYNWGVVSGPGSVTFANSSAAQTTATFGAAGTYVLRLSASDSELTAADDVTVTQTAPPAAGITSPADGATITGRTVFAGTVGEGSTWRLEYSLNEEGVAPAWTAISSGSTPVTNAPLGTFDPTLLLNGIYTVRLVAANGAGQTTTSSVRSVVEGEQKVGNFSISFTDLNVPVAGMPMEVVRTYDSRDKRAGDFGTGWTLDIRNVRVQESGRAGAGWRGTVSGGFFPSYCVQAAKPHLVTITMPDGEVYRFEAVIGPQCSTLYPLREATISFRALPGTNARLAPVGESVVYVNASFPGDAQLLDYNTLEEKDFEQYELTLPEGRTLLIDQRGGLRKMTDANGNTLTVSAGGITHSSGKSITFRRDPQGRITEIVDPAGASSFYTYDARGDLASHKDREGNTTAFEYNSTHGLLSIKDPRGLQPVRNEYDNEGRLVRQIDAFGKVINFSHDPNLRQEAVTDRLGKVTTHEYNARGQVVRITDAAGGVTTRTYDSRDNVLSETNALGQVTTFTYDALNNKLSETDTLGNTTRYTYDSRNNVLTVADALGRVRTNGFDANGNLVSTKDPSGLTTSATYDARGKETSVTDALGQVTRFEYDAAGNLTKQTDPLGNSTTYTYDVNGNRLSESHSRTVAGVAETHTTTHQYDRQNRLVKTTRPDGSTVETVYNSISKPAAVIDGLGRRTTYEYDEMGRLSRTTYPDGTREEALYDAEGRRTASIDRAGRRTDYTYDALGRPVKTVYPGGASTTLAYDATGRATSVTDARGNTLRYEYDAAGRQVKSTDPAGNMTTFTYDGTGNQTAMTDAAGQTVRYEYDPMNRLTKSVYPDNTSSATAYDVLGRVTSRTDQAGRVTRFEYDARGKLTKVTDALGGVTRYTYDGAGNQLTQTDANNHTTSYEYDALGRRVKRTLPLGMSETYAYDLGGNLIARTDFRNRRTTYAYDAMNRLTARTPDPALGEAPAAFTYTPTGRRATMTDDTGTTTYTYDLRDRLLSKAGHAGTLAYTYDAAGNLLSARSSNPDGLSADYAYDALNRLGTVTDNQLPGGAGATTYAYDPNGNLASTALPNGVETRYTYNSLNRLTQVSAASGGATLASYAYTLGAAGNRLSVTEHTGRRADYTYDALYRLTEERISGDAATDGVIGYGYDPVGNRLSRTSTVAAVAPTTSAYDANDRRTSDTYDQNGNTTASAGSTFAYDAENRLTEANGGTVRYAYDGDGNRVSKTEGGVTTHYLVDTNNPTGHAQVVEELVGGQVTRQYTYGHDLISQRQRLGGAWRASFYGYDGQGSTRYLTDAAGAVTDTYTYDAFGVLIASTGTTPNEFLYVGERFDANVGFYYLRARYLNPSSGRFLTMDTYEGNVHDPLSLHKYLYAHASPLNAADPTGQFGDFSISGMMAGVQARMTMMAISYPRFARLIAFVVEALTPLEVQVAMPSFGMASGIGFLGAMTAAKQLPLLKRAYETARGIARTAVGDSFETWVGQVLKAQKNTVAVRGGQVVTGGTRAGAAIPDYFFRGSILEAKTSFGAVKKHQLEELARYAGTSGQGLTYVFLHQPSASQIATMRRWAQAAGGVDVEINYIYP